MNEYHTIIRNRLKAYRKECLNCLYPENGYAWGGRQDIKRTVQLLNNILKDIPIEAWPVNREEMEDSVIIASNNWRIDLMWIEKRRSANLIFKKDDHTAWVIEHSKKKGTYVDFDIGGS